ncbi:MAG: hypothetical protein WA151_21900, partial [Desulfatirhabdiaceae bacterium]
MHGSNAHDRAGERVMPLFDGNPTPCFYEVLIGYRLSEKSFRKGAGRGWPIAADALKNRRPSPT